MRNNIDVIIIGGGIQGLWILNQLTKLGYSCILITDKKIGEGQSLDAQIYKHKGHFYNNLEIAQHLQEVEPEWDNFINNNNLKPSQKQQFLAFPNQQSAKKYTTLWYQGGLKYSAINNSQIPLFFQQGILNQGHYFDTGESCYHGHQLISKLAQPVKHLIYQGKIIGFNSSIDGFVKEVKVIINNKLFSFAPKRVVFTAGRGNQALLNQITQGNSLLDNHAQEIQQLRRCQVLVIKGENLPSVTALCPSLMFFMGCRQVGNENIWLITYGFDDPIKLELNQAIPLDKLRLQECLNTLEAVIPNIFELDLEWGLYPAVKAESVALGAGFRPNEDFVSNCGLPNVTLVYPTKLSLAPRASKKIVNQIVNSFNPSGAINPMDLGLPKTEVAIAKERWQSISLLKWVEFKQSIFN